jgi:hypothetical protein
MKSGDIMKPYVFYSAFFVVATLALSACGHNYTYEDSYGSCSTGKHSFESKDAYCKGLEDERLNNGCAASMRAQDYQNAECPGQFEQSYD